MIPMTTIFPGFGNVKSAMSNLADCQNIEQVTFTLSKTAGAVGIVNVAWPAFTCFMDHEYHTVAAGNIDCNSTHVASPTTFYVYFELVAGVPTAAVSQTDPSTNPAVDEHFIVVIVRFVSPAGTATILYSTSPAKKGLYELAHSLKEDSVYTPPVWISGISPTYAAGGKISTTPGYVRFVGNAPDLEAAVTDGTIIIDDEVTTVAGLNDVTTYSDGSTITAGSYVKMLLGWKRGSPSQLNGKLMLIRQGNPGIPAGEYATAAAAYADALNVAPTGFGNAYRFTVVPLAYIVMKKGDYTDGAQYDVRAGGITGIGGGGAAINDHSLLLNLNVVGDHTLYLDLAGTRALTGNWNAGAKSITTSSTLSGSQLISTIADGTKPLDITSKTMTTNLNADMVDGVHEASFVLADGSRALTGNWAAAKDITTVGNMGSAAFTATGLAKADTFQSTHAIGVAPFTATSTTMCTNLNADAVDGIQGANIVTADGLTPLTAAWDVGSWQVRAETFQSDIATIAGAPFTVASTTVVTNLNADTVDGNHAAAFAVAAKGVTNGDTHDHSGGDGAQIAHSTLSGLTAPADDHTQYLLADGTRALSGNWNAGSKSITTTSNLSGSQIVSTIADGTAPLVVTSKTVTSNLNADMLDGLHSTAMLLADGSQNLTGNLSVTGGVTIDGVDISAHAININAHHSIMTISNDLDTKLMALTGQELDLDTQTANYVFAGPASGAAAKPTFRQLGITEITRPSTTLDISATPNNDVALTAGYRVYVVQFTGGFNSNFTITGFTGGVDGAVLYLHNNTAKTMTLSNLTGSSANNQIKNTQGTTVATGRSATLTYITAASLNKWVVTSIY